MSEAQSLRQELKNESNEIKKENEIISQKLKRSNYDLKQARLDFGNI